MGRLKILLVTLIFTISTVIFAERSARIYDLQGLSAEIEMLLRDSDKPLMEGNSVTVFFSISEDKTIQYVTVAAPTGEMSQLLQEKLFDHQLDGNKWREGIIYELTIEGRTSVACISK